LTTPEKIYIEVLNGEITPRWAPNREDKSDVEYVRGDLHEELKAKVAALRRENERYEFLRERASDESWPEWCTWEMLGEAEGAEWDALVDRLMEEY